jgi:hypothetical protein
MDGPNDLTSGQNASGGAETSVEASVPLARIASGTLASTGKSE